MAHTETRCLHWTRRPLNKKNSTPQKFVLKNGPPSTSLPQPPSPPPTQLPRVPARPARPDDPGLRLAYGPGHRRLCETVFRAENAQPRLVTQDEHHRGGERRSLPALCAHVRVGYVRRGHYCGGGGRSDGAGGSVRALLGVIICSGCGVHVHTWKLIMIMIIYYMLCTCTFGRSGEGQPGWLERILKTSQPLQYNKVRCYLVCFSPKLQLQKTVNRKGKN